MNGSEDRAEAIFSQALHIVDPEARRAYLERACAGDEELRSEVESLLAAHSHADDFLVDPPTIAAPPLTEDECFGARIGRYQLLEIIGEGGFANVWMAAQQEPIRRRVALKILKPGLDSRQVIGRFEAERQALGLMDHPNIAKVFDAGTTPTGRPYFVMELVRGIRITEFCDTNHLPTESRLDLFIQVCQAVQHAHQKGIIHRDLKPSNILVTLHDGVPVPKVIDFGIAKATQQPLTDKTVFTQFLQLLGTPSYMSPEQAELSGLDIDTRSDIYSLGVLLYELLTGKPPFDPKTLLAVGLDEMRRILREQEPPRPSTKLSTLKNDDLSSLARMRRSDPPKLLHLIRGDLDSIVMKCLEKDRARRYDTATGLAADIRHYLNQEPITARPPSNLYRFRKLVRRNKLAFAAAGAVAAALILGLCGTTWSLLREREARRRAVAAETQERQLRVEAQTARASEARQRAQAEADQKTAQIEAAKNRQTAQFLKDMLAGVKPAVAVGRDTVLLKEILDKASARIGAELQDQPEVEAELRTTLGEVYSDVNEFAKAEAMFRRALELRQQLHGAQHRTVAEALANLGGALYNTGKLDEGEDLLRQAAAMGRQLLGSDDLLLAELLDSLGRMLTGRKKIGEAEVIGREAVAIFRKLGQVQTMEMAAALHDLAVAIWEDGRPAEAEVFQKEAHEIFRTLKGDESVEVAHSLNNLATMAGDQGRKLDAERLLRQSLTMRQKLFPPVHQEIAQSLLNLGGFLMEARKLDEAEPLLRQGHDIELKLGESPRLVWSCAKLGALLGRRNQLDEAERLLRQGATLGRRILGLDHGWTANCIAQLAAIKARRGEFDEAESMWREVLFTTNQLSALEHGMRSGWLSQFAEFLASQGKWAEAELVLREAVATAQTSRRQDPFLLARHLNSLASAYASQNKLTEAESAFRQALAIYGQNPADHLEADAETRHELAHVLHRQRNFAESETLFRQAIQTTKALDQSEKLPHLLDSLAVVLNDTGKLEDAEAVYRQAVTAGQEAFGEAAVPTAESRHELAHVLERRGKLAESESYLRQALPVLRKARGDEHSQVPHLFESLASVLHQQGKLAEAETLFAEGLASVPDSGPARIGLIAARGQFRARLGRWIDAAADLSQAVKHNPRDSTSRFVLAPLLVHLGDTNAFEALRQDGLSIFRETTNAAHAQRMAKHCLILPWSEAGTQTAARWAELALTVGPDDRNWLSFLFTKALADYRQGKVSDVESSVRTILEKSGENPHRDVQASALLAMARHRLGQPAEAREALAQAQQIAATKLPGAGSADFGAQWANWLMAQTWLREAEAQLKNPPPTHPFANRNRLRVGDLAPPVSTGRWIQGEPVSEFEPGKVYIVDFWATWCGPCTATVPHLNELHKTYRDRGLIVIGQNSGEDNESLVEPYVKKMGDKMTYRVALDDKTGTKAGKMDEAWMGAAGLPAIPMAFIVNRAGLVAWIGHPWGITPSLIESLLSDRYDVQQAAAEFLEWHVDAYDWLTHEAALAELRQALQNRDLKGAARELAKIEPIISNGMRIALQIQILQAEKDYAKLTEFLEKAYRKPNPNRQSRPQAASTLNHMAMTLATQKEPTPESLAAAEKFARWASEALQDEDGNVLDTWARVLFRQGRQPEAIALQEKAVQLAPDGLKQMLQPVLESFRRGESPK